MFIYNKRGGGTAPCLSQFSILLLILRCGILVDNLITLHVLECLHVKGDFSVLRIKLDNLCLGLIADFKDIQRLVDVLSCSLGDMKQYVYARLELDESAKIGHTHHMASDNPTLCILLSRIDLRILIREP